MRGRSEKRQPAAEHPPNVTWVFVDAPPATIERERERREARDEDLLAGRAEVLDFPAGSDRTRAPRAQRSS